METIEELLELAQKTGYELSLWTCEGSMYLTARNDERKVEATFEAQGDYASRYRSLACHMRDYLSTEPLVKVEKTDGEKT